MESTDYDRKRLDRGLTLLYWLVEGKRTSLRHALADVNKAKIISECDDLLYLYQFAETNVKELGI